MVQHQRVQKCMLLLLLLCVSFPSSLNGFSLTPSDAAREEQNIQLDKNHYLDESDGAGEAQRFVFCWSYDVYFSSS